MKKQLFTILFVGLAGFGTLQAQSVRDGIDHFYAERYKSATAAFQKNAGDAVATYWLGQTQLADGDTAAALTTYNGSAANALSIVGLGQIELAQGKVNEARQRFETAITMSKGRKSNDPVVLNAVGRAIAEVYNDKTKLGDINYAIQKLEEAVTEVKKDNDLLADIYLNLGNAYRRARPGEAGGQAFSTYQKAIAAKPNFAVAHDRIAQLFFTQKNWSTYEKYLNDAIAADAKYAPAYYKMYYLKLGDQAARDKWSNLYLQNVDPDPKHDYIKAQTLYANKDFDGAINSAKGIITQTAPKSEAKLYKLIADSYLQKKDTPSAKPFIDDYFKRAKADEIIALDYQMKVAAYAGTPGMEGELVNIYMEGVKMDTTLENQLKLLKEGEEFFEKRKMYTQQAALLDEVLKLKKEPTINDYFYSGVAHYFAKEHAKSREIFTLVAEKFPTEPFGWEWKFNNAQAVDTVKKDSIAVPDAINLATFAEKDLTKYKKQYLSAVRYLASYYVNDAKDFDKSLEYFQKWKDNDPENAATIQSYIDQINQAKQSQSSRSTQRSTGSK